MRKTIIMILTAVLVIAGAAVYVYYGDFEWSIQEVLMAAGLVIIIGFAAYLIIQRLRSSARKEAMEDEFSKKVMQKASSLSFYISLYWWLAVSFISETINWETHTLIGGGILGMAIIFFFCWLGVRFTGLKDG